MTLAATLLIAFLAGILGAALFTLINQHFNVNIPTPKITVPGGKKPTLKAHVVLRSEEVIWQEEQKKLRPNQ